MPTNNVFAAARAVLAEDLALARALPEHYGTHEDYAKLRRRLAEMRRAFTKLETLVKGSR